MKMFRIVYRAALPSLVMIGLGAAPASAGILDKLKGEKPPGNEVALRIDETDIDRSQPSAVSFAPVVDRVNPSVVSVFSYRMVRYLNDPRMAPWANDPFFRYFFGTPDPRRFRDRGRGQQQDEDQPQAQTEEEKVPQGLGSGVIVTEDGYILTNHHVIDRADEVGVRLPDSVEELPAKVIGSDPSTDIAVLKIEGKKFPAIAITDSERIQVGDKVLAIGNPLGVGQTVTQGIVSAKRRRPFDTETDETGRRRTRQVYEDYIQTDAAINFGNSGGPLVDIQGRLIGINSAIVSQTGGNIGIGFAVPMNIARYVLKQLVKYGKVNRGMLGVAIQNVTADFAAALKLPSPSGALVSEVVSGGSAEKAGIQPKDVIVGFNNREIRDSHDLQVLTAHTEPGAQVALRLIRDGKEQTVSAVLGQLGAPSGSAKARGEEPPGAAAAGESLFNGVEITELDAAARRDLNAPAALKGVLVKSVARDSRAADGGLAEGDVIVEIGESPVASIDDAQRAAEAITGHRVLLRVWRQGATIFLAIRMR